MSTASGSGSDAAHSSAGLACPSTDSTASNDSTRAVRARPHDPACVTLGVRVAVLACCAPSVSSHTASGASLAACACNSANAASSAANAEHAACPRCKDANVATACHLLVATARPLATVCAAAARDVQACVPVASTAITPSVPSIRRIAEESSLCHLIIYRSRRASASARSTLDLNPSSRVGDEPSRQLRKTDTASPP